MSKPSLKRPNKPKAPTINQSLSTQLAALQRPKYPALSSPQIEQPPVEPAKQKQEEIAIEVEVKQTPEVAPVLPDNAIVQHQLNAPKPESDAIETEEPVTELIDQEVTEDSELVGTGAEEKRPEHIFQAIGVLRGEVSFDPKSRNATITLDGIPFRLGYAYTKRIVLQALYKECLNSGATQEVIVYPKVLHLPRDRNKEAEVYFELVGFRTPTRMELSHENDTTKDLKPGEFILSGIWQFIPVCPVPCISILKNFTEERLKWLKGMTPTAKVNFMKASHIPLLWWEAPIKPFRFNSKIAKEEQGKRSFVKVKAIFVPERGVFKFDTLITEPMQKLPSYLKAKDEDKAEAIAEKKKKKGNSRPSSTSGNGNSKPVPKPKPKGTPNTRESSPKPKSTPAPVVLKKK